MLIKELKKPAIKYAWKLSFKHKDMYVTFYCNDEMIIPPFFVKEGQLTEKVQTIKNELLKANNDEFNQIKKILAAVCDEQKKNSHDKRLKELLAHRIGILEINVP